MYLYSPLSKYRVQSGKLSPRTLKAMLSFPACSVALDRCPSHSTIPRDDLRMACLIPPLQASTMSLSWGSDISQQRALEWVCTSLSI